MTRALLLLLAAGCYAPSAPSGSYTCGTDGDCPSNLRCTCGMCVASEGEAACSFVIEPAAGLTCAGDAQAGCVVEGQPFQVTLTAFQKDGVTQSSYGGTATIGSTWGHAVADPFHFAGGKATANVRLDRATPPNSSLTLFAQAGTASSASASSLVVDPPAFTADAAPTLAAPTGWADYSVGDPSVVKTDSGYAMYFSGVATKPLLAFGIGAAKSSDGIAFVAEAAPAVSSDTAYYTYPSALRLSKSDTRLFTSRILTKPSPTIDVFQLQSTDGGATFAEVGSLIGVATCPPTVCFPSDAGLILPSAMRDPVAPNDWRVYFNRLPTLPPKNDPGYPTALAKLVESTLIGVSRTADGGKTWHVDPVPTPAVGPTASVAFAYSAQARLDRRPRRSGVRRRQPAAGLVERRAQAARRAPEQPPARRRSPPALRQLDHRRRARQAEQQLHRDRPRPRHALRPPCDD